MKKNQPEGVKSITVKPCTCGNEGKFITTKSNPSDDVMENRCYLKPRHKMRCPKCGRETGWYSHLYYAVVEWNGEEISE